MNVFIGGDSRCSHGTVTPDVRSVTDATDSWSNRLIWKHLDVKFFTRRSSVEIVSYSIYDSDPYFNDFEDGFFDLAFIQTGFNDGIEYWPERVFKKIVGKHFDKKNLVNRHEVQDREDFYRYVDRATEKEMFDLIKRKCKKVVFIGMHCLLGFKGIRSDLYPSYVQTTTETNESFSKQCHHYIRLRNSTKWTDYHCRGDRIHYNEKGIDFVLEKVEKYL